MSGIGGITHSDGRPVNRTDLGRMMSALAPRGPDGSGVWLGASVGLAHRMFHETPESLQEKQPCVSEPHQLALTADARIDNREDLIRELGLRAEDPLSLPDSWLILLSYAKWGEDCAEHLIGDFAFALWDGRKQCLFCARDYIGTKPFYYSFLNNRFLFASEPRGMLCLDDVPRDLNDEKIADYLALDFSDKERSFYKAISRLPPAHTLRVDRQGLHVRRYWEPDLETELRLKSQGEYEEAFRETFAEAVRCRLRSVFPIGSTLSGGMDSSSVTCMARDLLTREGRGRALKTYSATFGHLPHVDEQRYQDSVIAAGGIESYKIPMDEIGPLEAYLDGQRHIDYPYLGATYYLHWGMHQQMRYHGVKIALDGFAGDAVVSHGIERLSDLARSLRLLTFYREGRAFAKACDAPVMRTLWRLGLRPNTPGSLLSMWRRVRYGKNANKPVLGNVPVTPDLARRTMTFERARERELSARRNSLRQSHADDFTNGFVPFTLETYDQLPYANSLVTRYPFLDRRLAEFCLSLPSEHKLRGGWTRMILRRSMEGILPAENQWRPDKANLSPHFKLMLSGKETRLLLKLLDDAPSQLGQYVRMNTLRERCENFIADGKVDPFFATAWPAITFSAWLRSASISAVEGTGGADPGANAFESVDTAEMEGGENDVGEKKGRLCYAQVGNLRHSG